MALKHKTHDIEKVSTAKQAPQPQPQMQQASSEHLRPTNPAVALQRAVNSHPAALRPADILVLQRTIGNRAVGRILSTRPNALPPQPSTPASAIQRKTEEGESLQAKLETNRRKDNRTGLPDNLKSGIENLSGMAMDDVRVHYNSSAPAQVQALAYTQGTDIHVGPGQEQHLPHEAWHVAQQKQGRVKPTLQAKGVAINDDQALEKEADVMGQQASHMTPVNMQADRNRDSAHLNGKSSLNPSPLVSERRIPVGRDQLVQLWRQPPEEEPPPFPKLTGKKFDELYTFYQQNFAAGIAAIDKYLQRDDKEVVEPPDKFAQYWTLETSNAGKGRRQYEYKHKNEDLKSEGKPLHYKNIIFTDKDGNIQIEALSNYGPTKKMRDDKEPGCNTFLTDAWQAMLKDYNSKQMAKDQRLYAVVRSNIENESTLATIFLSTHYSDAGFDAANAADRVALLGSPNGIGYLQMLANYPYLLNLDGLIKNDRFTVRVLIYGPHRPYKKADMILGGE